LRDILHTRRGLRKGQEEELKLFTTTCRGLSSTCRGREEAKSRHVDFQCVKSKSVTNLAEAAADPSIDGGALAGLAGEEVGGQQQGFEQNQEQGAQPGAVGFDLAGNIAEQMQAVDMEEREVGRQVQGED